MNEFYTRQIEHAFYPSEHFFKSLDDKAIEEFVDKIFYSYERLYKESYYRSQSGYWQYKGDKEKAKKFAIKSVNCNDMVSKKEKEKLKRNYSKQRDFGIKFCK
ncbi:MAG: hypothetical protein HRU07_04510 [Nitrosopumilus sp.]|nr:hypothetical protein [Nitrosopumilus sp.]NRA05415.1 hypothetical protein [Nitrosopumilus sp.]